MHARPLSVTIVAWFLIVSAVIAGAGILYMTAGGAGWPAPAAVTPTLYWAITIGSVAVTLLCGIFMLRGANWARWLFLVWNAAILILDLVTVGADWTIYITIVLLALIAFLLFTKSANDWFAGRAPAVADEEPVA